MSDRWTDAFQQERASQTHGVPPANRAWQTDYQVAGWREIAEWAAANGMKFDGNTNAINTRRKAQGKKPFYIARGPVQCGYRVL